MSTSIYAFSSLSLPYTCSCTCIHTPMLLKCSCMPQVAGFHSSYKRVWKTRLKCLALGLNWQCLCLCLLHLEARVHIPFLFFIPLTAPITRYHMLCTYLALNKCLLNGWLFLSTPPFPPHPYSITLKICCRARGRGLRSVLTNNPYGCLKPKDRIFKAEIWAVTSWVFCEEMHKAVQIDSISDRT